MDDLQFWLYIIIGIIYLITQVRKKAKEQQNLPPETPSTETDIPRDTSMQTDPTSTTSSKPLTFEELLKEITESKQKQTSEYETTQSEYVDYDDNIPDEIQDLEDVDIDYQKSDPIYKQYEDAKYQDYSSKGLEESLKLEDVDVKYGRFAEFETAKEINLVEEYTRDLRDPKGMKKAIVLAEILNPRYF